MSKLIPEYDIEKEGNLVCKKNLSFNGNAFEFRVYSYNGHYIGRVYLDGKRHNPQDYMQEMDDVVRQQYDGYDICERFFKVMEGDLKSIAVPGTTSTFSLKNRALGYSERDLTI